MWSDKLNRVGATGSSDQPVHITQYNENTEDLATSQHQTNPDMPRGGYNMGEGAAPPAAYRYSTPGSEIEEDGGRRGRGKEPARAKERKQEEEVEGI